MIYINEDNKLSLSRLHENQRQFVTSKYLHTGIVGGYQCLPGYTEYLTTNGWKQISDYNDDNVLVFNPETKQTHFEQPIYINQPGGEFIKFSTDTINMEVTPNHRVIYQTEKKKEFQVTTADKLKNRVRIPRTFEAPKLPGVDLADSEIRLQVAISADSNIENKKRVRFNLKKERKKKRMIRLLKECGIDYTIYNNSIGDGYMKLAFVPPMLTKDLSFLFKANKNQLAVVADECQFWDGSVYGCGSVEVSGIDKSSLDLIQYAITTTGRAASLLITDKREYKSGDMYNVRAYKHNYSGLRYCQKEKTHHERQYCFNVSTGFFIVRQNGHIFITGNSGKSVAATVKMITHIFRYPGVPIAYYLPTFRLFEDMFLPKVEDIFPAVRLPFTHNQKESVIIAKVRTPDNRIVPTKILLRSMDTPDSIVSYSVGYSIVDEVDVVHPNKRDKAMKRISSRNSFQKDTPNQIDFVSTPEGFAYMYNFFVKNKNENKLLLKLKTGDNEENLADGYIQGLREQYTKEQLEAYLNGEFVNLTSGTVYYNYERNLNHTDRIATDNEAIHVGIDFNIGNMSAIIHVIDQHPEAVDEITGAHDTNQLCNIIQERYPNNRILCYPDASGKNRSTNADKSDIQIIESFGFKVRAKNKNPLVMDRVKNVNRMFCNANGERKYFVNRYKCPEYIEALERLSFDKNGIPDKSSGFDHLCDAGGYFISYMYPSANEFKAFW